MTVDELLNERGYWNSVEMKTLTTQLRDLNERFIFQGGSEYANNLAYKIESLVAENDRLMLVADECHERGIDIDCLVKERDRVLAANRDCLDHFNALKEDFDAVVQHNIELQEKLRIAADTLWEVNKYVDQSFDQSYSDLIGDLGSEWLAARYVKNLSPLISDTINKIKG